MNSLAFHLQSAVLVGHADSWDCFKSDPFLKNHDDDDDDDYDYDDDDGSSRFLWNVSLFQIPLHYINIDMAPITTTS